MIKVIAFDLVGVLVREKDINLSLNESKLERLFGPNLNDIDYINKASIIINDDIDITTITRNTIQKLYETKNKQVLKELKANHKDIKIIIATNHLTYIRKFIETNFNEIDDIIISAEINKIKPNPEFYNYILEKYNIKPSELLFLDDNEENINGAIKIGVNAITVHKNTDIINEINKFI